MKILAKMEDMHVETISGDSKFVLNNGHEEEEDARGIPVPSMHLPLEQHRMPYSSSNGSERLVYGQQLFRDRLGVLHQNNYRAGSSVPLEQQYSSSSAPYDDNDEESVKTEITEETDIEEGEEDQIIPGLVISTTANSAPETKESSENTEPRTSSSGKDVCIRSALLADEFVLGTYVSPTSALAKTDEQTQKPSSPVGNKTEAVPQGTEQEQPGSTLESIRSPDNWSETARVQEEVSETANVATSQPAGDDESRREDISSIKSPLRVQSMRAQRLYLNPRQPTEVSPTNSTATYHPASSSASDSLPSPPKPTTVVEKPKIAKKERQSAEQLPKRVSRQRTKLQRYNPDVEAAKPQLLQHETKKEQVQHLRQIKSGKERKKSHESYTPYDPKYDLKVRTRVKARWSSGNRTYKAMITGINADGTYKLLYNDGGRWDRVPRRRILEYAGSASQELKRPRVQTAKKARNKPLKRRRARSKRAESDEEDSPPPKKKRGRRSTGHAKRMEHEFRGLTWSQQKRKWIARIYHKNSTVHLGTFTDPEEAARMYDWAARPLGKKLNFPTDADLRSQEKKLKKGELPREAMQQIQF